MIFSRSLPLHFSSSSPDRPDPRDRRQRHRQLCRGGRSQQHHRRYARPPGLAERAGGHFGGFLNRMKKSRKKIMMHFFSQNFFKHLKKKYNDK